MESQDEHGFSLVEVVVAMFLFGLLAMAVLPLTIQAVELSTVNPQLVAANALASDRLAVARERFPDDATTLCSEVAAHAGPDVSFSRDGHVATYALASDGGDAVGCAGLTAYPTTVPVTVEVREDLGEATVDRARPILVSLTTLVVVTGP